MQVGDSCGFPVFETLLLLDFLQKKKPKTPSAAEVAKIATEMVTRPSWLRGIGDGGGARAHLHRPSLGERANVPLEGLSQGREPGQSCSLLSLNAQRRAPLAIPLPLQTTSPLQTG